MVLIPGQYSCGIQSPAIVDPLWLRREPEAEALGPGMQLVWNLVGLSADRSLLSLGARGRGPWLPCPPPPQSWPQAMKQNVKAFSNGCLSESKERRQRMEGRQSNICRGYPVD